METGTVTLIGTIIGAASLVFGVFRFFLGQVKNLSVEMAAEIADARRDANKQIEAIVAATDRRFSESAERRHDLANRTQENFNAIGREYVRRDDFNTRVTEILTAIKDVRDRLDQTFRNGRMPGQ